MNIVMHEDFLQYVWKNGLFKTNVLRAKGGERIEVIDIGRHNTDAGPDFFNACVKIGDVIWAGNVEIHLRASDWYKHKHHINSAYNNVILHVVDINDKDVFDSSGRLIPTVKISYIEDILFEYEKLFKTRNNLPCLNVIGDIERISISAWLNKLAIERLQQKTERIIQVLTYNNNSWEETFYQLVARYFGLNVNSEPFELLARSTPLKILLKNRHSEFAIESILFGQACMLEVECRDTYYMSLKKEYSFYSKKYELTPILSNLWKHLRLRPSNFPEVRLAQFANLIYKNDNFFSKVLECVKVDDVRKLFEVRASSYWDRHFSFKKTSVTKVKQLGKISIDIIIINAVIPVIFAYGMSHDLQNMKDKAFSWLEDIQAEQNNVVRYWKEAGVMIKTAFESQALIHLERTYCSKHRCLYCDLGKKILRKSI